MSYKIAFKKTVARDLKKNDKNIAEKILQKIEQALPDKADTFPALKGKFTGLRKFRVGHYRVVYSIIDDTAIILRIGHRRKVYRVKI